MAIGRKRKLTPKHSMGTKKPKAERKRRLQTGIVTVKEPDVGDFETSPHHVKVESTLKCAICLDTSRCKRMKFIPCGHGFHEMCINRWFTMDKKCPLCRTYFQ